MKYNANINSDTIREIAYRPFDNKYALYIPKGIVVDSAIKTPSCYRTRYDVMKNFCLQNYAILIGRQGLAIGEVEWSLCLFTNKIADLNIFYRGGENVFPTYLYREKFGVYYRESNLKKEFKIEFYKKTGINFSLYNGDKGYDVLILSDYMYAVLYSPKYREKYKEFLKIDFPRVPYPTDKETFWKLVEIGSKLRECHLMHTEFDTEPYSFVGDSTNEVVKPEYKNGRVYISKTQYFDNVPQAQWEQYIGGF